MRIVLASQSLGRKQLLDWLHLPYESLPADIDETELPNEQPQVYVKRLAETKAKTIYKELEGEAVVIGADTTVCFNNQIIGKPADMEDARNTLRKLRNTFHFVYTGIAVIGKDWQHHYVDTSKVIFKDFSDQDLETYLKHEDPLSKAAGYTVLRTGKLLTKEIQGSITGVIGLPIKALVECLELHGMTVPEEGIVEIRSQVGRFD